MTNIPTLPSVMKPTALGMLFTDWTTSPSANSSSRPLPIMMSTASESSPKRSPTVRSSVST